MSAFAFSYKRTKQARPVLALCLLCAACSSGKPDSLSDSVNSPGGSGGFFTGTGAGGAWGSVNAATGGSSKTSSDVTRTTGAMSGSGGIRSGGDFGIGGSASTGGRASSGGSLATGGKEARGTSANGGAATGGSVADGSAGAAGSGNSLAATPPMGWNSWNTFQCDLSESVVKAVADVMVTSGMKAAGYEYVNLDDCWMNGRDSNGNLRWNTTKFPSGIPALADYIHGKGLKFGIYQSANTRTCVGIYGGIDAAVAVGSLGRERQDATTFATWGVDFLKYDLCAGQRSSIVTMGTALRNAARPIVYSINPGNGENDLDPPKVGWDMLGVANIWRIGFDIAADWASVVRLIDQNANLFSYAGPGHFNDPDMLEVGKLGNATEDRAHFSMWAIMAAPLIAGNDIRSMSNATRDILTNSEVIAVDQDPLGLQGRLVATPAANLQIWSKTLTGTNIRAVCLLNRGTSSTSITVQWTAIGLPSGNATVRDLWSHTDLGSFANSYMAPSIPGHGVVMLRIAGTS